MLEVHPVTPDRWDDLAGLFGPNGAYSGCWCMWWRVPSRVFSEEAGGGLRERMRGLVGEGAVPGLIGYRDGGPVGWVSLGPRHEFSRLERSPKLKRVDDEKVWSIVCFFVHRRHRREGVSSLMLEAAVGHARSQGAGIVEAYPIDTSARDPGAAALYTGTLGMFLAAGFEEVARRGGRPIVRRRLT